MATRKLEVQILGDDRQLSRTFGHAGKQARGFERDIGKASRGALAGSGAFRSMGRSLAFASGAFVGVASITAALRASVDAAEEFAKASKGLGAQLKANGESAAANASQIAKANAEMAKFGITASESETALARLDRATGNIGQAIKLEGLAANLSAARHISLAQAALVVGKVVQGTTTAFNRLGLVLKKGTSVQDALRIATAKFAGQALAASTPLERLHAGVTNIEVAVGEALLPTINRIATSLNKWLSNSENVARVQRDVRQAVKVATSALQAAKAIVEPLVAGFRALAAAVGGTTHAFEVLFALGIARKLGLFSLALGATEGAGLAGAATRTTTALRGLSRAMAIFQASVAIGGIRGALLGLGSLRSSAIKTGLAFRVGLAGAIAFAGFELSKLIRKIPHFDSTFKKLGGGLEGLLSRSHGARIVLGLPAPPEPFPKQLPGPPRPVPFAFRNPNAPTTRPGGNPFAGLPTGVGGGARGLSPQARLNLDELRLADAQRAQNVKLQRAILVDEERLTLKLRDQAKTLKDRTKFAQQAAQIEDQIRSLDAQAASDAKARRDAARADRQRAAARAKAAAELARAFSIPLRLQLAEAKAAATKGTKDDLAAARAIKKLAEKALKSGRLGLQGQIDAWNAITTENQQIADLLKKTGKAVHTAFRKANLDKLLSGFGLTPDQVRAARARLSQIGPGGTVPGSGQGAFGFALPGTVVHVTNIDLDSRRVATATTKHQQRRDRRNPAQKRGPHAR